MKNVLKIAKWLGILLGTIIIGAISYIKFALPSTGETPVVNIEGTPKRVARGEYLANNVAVCMDCHSKRNWGLYAGPMAADGFGGGGEAFTPEMGFPGNFYAPNITPFALKNWSDGEIVQAITTGVDKDGNALFPVMGYHRFGKMDKEDIYSIVAYLRTLEPVAKDIPDSEPQFPVSLLINTMPMAADYQNIPAKTDKVAYGSYLVNAAGCVDCHSKTDKGAVIPGTEFGGGMEFVQPGGIVRSPNITSDEATGIGTWTQEAFTARFKLYKSPDYEPAQLKPGELNTPMPWSMYAGMTKEDLEAIFAYLNSVKKIENSVVRFEIGK